MLLEFQVENYLSFKERAKLSMMASAIKDLPEAVFTIDKYSILRSAAVFGANASGKSNLLKAMGFMTEFISKSAKESTFGKDIEVSNFKLCEETLDKPSTFEMTFLVKDTAGLTKSGNIIFRYGFQLDRTKVWAEWLFARFTAQESTLFTRIEDEIKIGEKFIEGKKVHNAVGNINKSTLFLSQIVNIKGENAPITKMVMSFFLHLTDITIITGETPTFFTASLLNLDIYKEKIVKFIQLADIKFEDIVIEDQHKNFKSLNEEENMDKFDKIVNDILHQKVTLLRNKYDNDHKVVGQVGFDLEKEESEGTKKFFSIIGVIWKALDDGETLIIDEIDTKLHPHLFLLIISLFNSASTNKNNAQLIFATHNTLIMDKRYFRRDQIYLVEKDKYGASELYSLLDYAKVRNDASYSKDYLMGKYGAVPYLGNFEALFNEV
ncbi:MAG: ATP-binding protein [Candidatus Cloacimonetes bacterium]|nr:ATP-binding protein [Candidatus Cloacimonadota bacterium]